MLSKSCINNESYLKDWKLPPSSASDIFKRSGCSWFPSSSVNTVEKEIRLNKKSATFPLLCEHLKRAHQIGYNQVHFGMIQVGLKPTKLGSNTSAIIRICDLRMINIRESPLAMVESSVCDGPIYFTHFPSFIVPVSDSCDIFGIDVEIQGDEGITLMYRFHYKLIKNFLDYNINYSRCEERGKTTLYVVNLAQGKRVVSKTMYWDQIGKGQGLMAVDWKETAKAHVVKVDVPGFKKEEVKIEVEDGGVLQISAERSNEEEESEKWHCKERSSGILRRLRLPESADLDEMEACMENGVLTITVPKEEVKPKKPVKIIEISG